MQCIHDSCWTWWNHIYAEQTAMDKFECDTIHYKYQREPGVTTPNGNSATYRTSKWISNFAVSIPKLAVWSTWRQMYSIGSHSVVALPWEHACSVNHQANNSIVCYANVNWINLLHETRMHEPIYLLSICCAHLPKSKCVICSHSFGYTYVNKANMKAHSSHRQPFRSHCAHSGMRTTK